MRARSTEREAQIERIARMLRRRWQDACELAAEAARAAGGAYGQGDEPDFVQQAAAMIDNEVQRMAGEAVLARLWSAHLGFTASELADAGRKVMGIYNKVGPDNFFDGAAAHQVASNGVDFVDTTAAAEGVVDRRIHAMHDDHREHGCVQGERRSPES